MPRFALGRLPADPTTPKLRLRRSATERPAPPASCDWLAEVREWGVLANDQVGDCTAAGAAHVAMLVDRYGQGRDLVVTDREALEFYAAISGYDGTPSTDVGATLQDALDRWRKVGIAGNQIVAAAQLDPQDLDLVRACIAVFGSVYCGMWITQANMDQLDRGQPWTPVRGSRNLGGHCIPIGAYDADSFTCVTWGQTQRLSIDLLLKQVDEIWVPVDLDWLAATGLSPAGLDVAALNADFESLTGSPGPFPPAMPAPAPRPTPCPVGDPDAALVDAFVAWRAAKNV